MARYSTPRYEDNEEEQFPFEQAPSSGGYTDSKREEHEGTNEIPIRTSDREELIQCIKRGQRTTWVPKPGLEAICAEVNNDQDTASPSTLPSQRYDVPSDQTTLSRVGMEDIVTRPLPLTTADALRRSMSSLHTGDFLGDFWERTERISQAPAPFSTPPGRPDLRPDYDDPPPFWQAENSPTLSLKSQQSSPSDILRRSRAPSLGSSLSSSFVMRIPTSPLVHATNNPTLDFSPRDPQRAETGTSMRRRTMPANAFESLHISPVDTVTPNFSRPLPYVQSQHRDGSSFPHGHRPRRSLSSFTYQAAMVPQAPPWLRQRRPSLAADGSPRHRASMVGSFEESILRGRMSTPSSKPLDFVAQIGVMGKGNCPASLKCPAHVSVPFGAVFYNYPSASTSRSISDDNPSPYVGNIDLEHNLKTPEEPRRRTRRSQANLDPEVLAAEITKPENTTIGRALAKEARERKENTSASSKVPSGGAYRVPQKGQLQLIIKNPNKTAVKLFLVPYDLEGMLPGTKTFVRQRSYSSGPILEAATLEKQAALAARDPLSTKDILRYLIHLKFCCTAKGRFYLYDSIRVVFANRVPDDKEKLRNEVQLPEPRFSAYKPAVGQHSQSLSVADEKLPVPTQARDDLEFDKLDDAVRSSSTDAPFMQPGSSSATSFSPSATSTFDRDDSNGVGQAALVEDQGPELERTVSPTPGFLPSTSSRSSPVPWPVSNGSSIAQGFASTPVEAGYGLLSRKFKEFNGTAAGQRD
ncbi:uncharacterized protein Z520_04060 [Fonsecaea multimorphosa CBS 102226]|uniref:Atos-like conserved domain-containing protein n=1 Tax=Fonsecaea multimorphosa CBS 102226 TaxID=1442371 RepID=A0A0D2KB64_9EURO|nr:uncharacterized protein Z520_04060 [Fonsecaea multimorphosa CBS 102226]KIY00375.1 hypothetical protein Z520_04060 [Fonsecaea multimorphosa CBS 102226]OAL27206.1 hypothetical protein AYO22_03837 [Fonsecaea multimorphosa]